MTHPKNSKGITLVALVITIIILLILAATTLGILVNEGLIGKTESATEEYAKSEDKEMIELIKADVKMGNEDRIIPLNELEKSLEDNDFTITEDTTYEGEEIKDNEIVVLCPHGKHKYLVSAETKKDNSVINPDDNTGDDSGNEEQNKTFTVSYDANGGEGAPEEETAEIGNSITISTVNPTKTGYTFLGWSTNKDTTIAEYERNKTYTFTETTKLYAVWQEIQQVVTYTVTYNYTENGGTSATATTAALMTNAKVDLTVTAEKPGYKFIGWNTDSNATTGLNQITIGESNITIYAIFSKEIKVTYSYNNETKIESKLIYNKEASVNLITLEEQEKEGYTFKEWNTKEDGTGTEYKANTEYDFTSDVTLYAVWEANQISVTIEETSYTYDGTAKTPTVTVKDGEKTLTKDTDYTVT